MLLQAHLSLIKLLSSRGFYDKSLACVTALYKDLESPQSLSPSFLIPGLHCSSVVECDMALRSLGEPEGHGAHSAATGRKNIYVLVNITYCCIWVC